MLRELTVSLPPMSANQDISVNSELATNLESAAINCLCTAGVLRPLTVRKRDQVYIRSR